MAGSLTWLTSAALAGRLKPPGEFPLSALCCFRPVAVVIRARSRAKFLAEPPYLLCQHTRRIFDRLDQKDKKALIFSDMRLPNWILTKR
jgi:hypothetical protein